MRFRFYIFVLLITGFFFIFSQKCSAIVDPLSSQNNKFGIHILEPSELEQAANLVNSSGGDWGYVTIPIRADDRYQEKWQAFFDKCGELHLIPILRLATYVRGNYWTKPTDGTLVDFANFLAELEWPTQNKYVVFFNEPNYALEWGGRVDPQDYARVLLAGARLFKEKDENFFVLPAGLDAAAPNDNLHREMFSFIRGMSQAETEIFNVIDGWVSHSYPNPGFVGNPLDTHKMSIVSYRHEINYLKKLGLSRNLPVFITETGWKLPEQFEVEKAENYKIAYEKSWNDESLVAITPFLLFAGDGDFLGFSMIKKDGSYSAAYKTILALKKNAGKVNFASKVLGTKTEAFRSKITRAVNHDSFLSLLKFSREMFFLGPLKNILARSQ
jgi:hypothetical protein